MKKIKWLVVSLLLGAAVFIGGLYLGNLEPERATGFSVQDIAIVNLDESVEYLGELRNFGSELMVGLDARYQLTGLSDARNGLETGRFAAYIVIPANFSQHVISINTAAPLESTFTFEISRYLEEQTRLLTLAHIMDFQAAYQERLSAMYLASILATFHEGQNNAEVVLQNDEIDLSAILNFNPISLLAPIVIEDLREFENTLVRLDTTEYRQTTVQITNYIIEASEEFMLLSQNQLAELLAAFGDANDYFWVSTEVVDPIPMLEEFERFSVILEISEYLLEIQIANEGLIGINEIMINEATTIIEEIYGHLSNTPKIELEVAIRFAEIQKQLTAVSYNVEAIRKHEGAIQTKLDIIIEAREVIRNASDIIDSTSSIIYEASGYINDANVIIRDTNIEINKLEAINYRHGVIGQVILNAMASNPDKSLNELIPILDADAGLNANIRELLLMLGFSYDDLNGTGCQPICTLECDDEESFCEYVCVLNPDCQTLVQRYLALTSGVVSLSGLIGYQNNAVYDLNYNAYRQNDAASQLAAAVSDFEQGIQVQDNAFAIVEYYMGLVKDLTAELELILLEVIIELVEILDELEIETDELLENFAGQIEWLLEQTDAIELELVEITYLDEAVVTESVTSQVEEQVDAEMTMIEGKLSILREDQEYFIDNIITSKRDGQEILAGYTDAILDHDLTDHIDLQRLNEYHIGITVNLRELDETVSENMREFVDFTSVVIRESDETISTIRTEVRDATTETRSTLDDEMAALRSNRQTSHTENQELLVNLTNTLAHSRAGSLVNHDLVNTLARPVEIRGNHDLRAVVIAPTNIDWMLPTIIGFITIAIVVPVLDMMISKDKVD